MVYRRLRRDAVVFGTRNGGEYNSVFFFRSWEPLESSRRSLVRMRLGAESFWVCTALIPGFQLCHLYTQLVGDGALLGVSMLGAYGLVMASDCSSIGRSRLLSGVAEEWGSGKLPGALEGLRKAITCYHITSDTLWNFIVCRYSSSFLKLDS